jgi:hypothetical protein
MTTLPHGTTPGSAPASAAADLIAAAPRIGRPRGWIASHLSTLVDAGRLEETRRPGVFRIA